nr:MepB protein [uncultured bacterium]
MKIFRSLSFFFVPFIALAATATLPDPAIVAESEKSFARAGIEHGIREAFLQFLADDAIIFAPTPRNGKAFYANYDKGCVLFWQPIFATISRSGELGVTTGPWHFKNSKTDTTPAGYGDFVSIWKRQADQSWKVALDLGINHGEPPDPPAKLQLAPPNEKSERGNDRSNGLGEREKRFSEALQVDAGQAILNSASEEIRLFRQGSHPAVGKQSAERILTTDHAKVTRQEMGRGLSSSNDLAYRYGSYSESSGGAVTGYFLTVWQTDRAGDWKIILDLQKKMPPEKKS